ncbi:MAG: exodeoxyribonuclease VII large subunit [Paludibacteraceae bacterium]|nr:exodeoxyribonuclease VII large subunit [Paludibacteraceae bacterium]
MSEEPLTLSAFNSAVRDVLEATFDEVYWVSAELSSVTVQRSGHCYLELIEKAADDDRVVARAKATIWAARYALLSVAFRAATGTDLRAGMQVLLAVKVRFHEAYGYSLDVTDLDPTYTIGSQARQKQQLLQRLRQEQWVGLGQSRPLPPVICRIALISSENAAGYGDFCRELEQNPYQLTFHYRLFPAAMQGDQAPASVTQALQQVSAHAGDFDAVVIVRGGGATSDLGCFDDYGLAVAVAQCPLPVLSGIGHDRDRSAVDEVARVALKTPTAVAGYLVDHNLQAATALKDLELQLNEAVQSRLSDEQRRMERLASELPLLAQLFLNAQSARIDSLMAQLQAVSPESVLSRGYALVTDAGGRVVSRMAQLQNGGRLRLQFADGQVWVTVEKK